MSSPWEIIDLSFDKCLLDMVRVRYNAVRTCSFARFFISQKNENSSLDHTECSIPIARSVAC